jgi:hypothetical protein
MELSLQIRPKLFEDISGCIDADLKAELGSGITCGPVVGVVGIRDGNCSGVADDFRIVELHAAGIAMCPESLANGVSES